MGSIRTPPLLRSAGATSRKPWAKFLQTVHGIGSRLMPMPYRRARSQNAAKFSVNRVSSGSLPGDQGFANTETRARLECRFVVGDPGIWFEPENFDIETLDIGLLQPPLSFANQWRIADHCMLHLFDRGRNQPKTDAIESRSGSAGNHIRRREFKHRQRGETDLMSHGVAPRLARREITGFLKLLPSMPTIPATLYHRAQCAVLRQTQKSSLGLNWFRRMDNDRPSRWPGRFRPRTGLR